MKSTPSRQRFTEAAKEVIRREPPAITDVLAVSVFLGQGEHKTREDIRLRRIPHLRTGGRVLVRRTDLERVLESLVVGLPRHSR